MAPNPKPPDHGPAISASGLHVAPPGRTNMATEWTARWPGVVVLWAGWLLPQFFLLGPALVGRTVAVPLDLLALPGVYLPNTNAYRHVVPNDTALLDLVLVGPVFREFSAKEFRAGRLPLWQSTNFAGAPFAMWPKYSPFELPYYFAPRPITFAWMQLLQVLVLGLGMCLYLRHSLNLSYWPAATGAWCAPLTGFITLWQGYPVIGPVCWFPWSLLVIHRAVTRPGGWRTISVAGVTALLLLSGQSDVGGLVLLTTGLYLVWLLASEHYGTGDWRRAAVRAAGVAAGWLLGFSLAAFYLVPLLDYSRSSARVTARTAGLEERPPEGLRALPAVVLRDFYGNSQRGSLRIVQGNRLESTSAAYSGLLAVFWLAPLAWNNARYRKETIFLTGLAVVSLGWTLNLPVVVDVLRLSPLNMLSWNRWVFATSSTVLMLAAIGLDQLLAGPLSFRRWYLVPILVAGGFGLCCLLFALNLPEPLRSQLDRSIRLGQAGMISLDDLKAAKQSFTLCYGVGALLSLAALIGWLSSFRGTRHAIWCRSAIVMLLPVEFIWAASQERRQGEPELYFPRLQALENLSELPSGRIWGVNCFPPNLNQTHGLEDIRGYDGVDPAQFVKLFELARNPRVESPSYAVTYSTVPQLFRADNRIKLHPVADLLNVRYLVLRKSPGHDLKVVAHHDDYWVGENPDSLPRAFVAQSVRVVKDDAEALRLMADPEFNPRAAVLMFERPDVPDAMRGTASIRYETPTRVHLDVNMETDGIVVISDLWDGGWLTELDGVPCPIHRVDVALRGLRVPAGSHVINMMYDPPCVRTGFKIAGAAGAILTLWMAWLLGMMSRTKQRVKHRPETKNPNVCSTPHRQDASG